MTANPPAIASHPDFNHPWIHKLLSTPELQYTAELPADQRHVSNNIFNVTLAVPKALKARLFFRIPSSEPTAITKFEECLIASLGDGLDGAVGRAHGGVSGLLLDQILGTCAQREGGSTYPCATATLTVDYKNPIATPTVLLLRAWVIEIDGRKIWTKGLIEDGKGKVFATAKALFIVPRDAPAPSL